MLLGTEKDERIGNMKITKSQLKQIIMEEMDDLEQDLYPESAERGDPDVPELSFEESGRYVEAWRQVTKAVESGALPKSVGDAVFDMLGKLGIPL